MRRRLRAARHRRGIRRGSGPGNGWQSGAKQRQSRHRSVRSRLLEGLSQQYGLVRAGRQKMSNNLYQMIARAQAEYARCIDDDRLEEWPNHFHGACVYKITTAANYRDGLEAGIIFTNSRGMLTDRVSALRQANIYKRQSYRHIIGQPA